MIVVRTNITCKIITHFSFCWNPECEPSNLYVIHPKLRAGVANTNREEPQGRSVKVIGSKGQRRLSLNICMSQFIELLNLAEAGFCIQKQHYAFDVSILHLSLRIDKTILTYISSDTEVFS